MNPRIHAEFVPFDPAQVALVAGWPQSAQEAGWWCGAGPFPVPAQTVADWQQDEDVRAHMLIADGAVAAYGELWVDDGEAGVELARIIVAPGARRQGLGRALVRGLLSEAAGVGYPDIFIRVHPDNIVALNCYRGTGFVDVDTALAQQWNVPQPVSYAWLHHAGAAPGSSTPA
ncbi:MAG: GNAT family N-acetyltransferase [Actinomycetota bacterium]